MSPPAPTLLVLIDLVQDLDVLAPVLARLKARGRPRLRIVVSAWLMWRTPRVVRILTGLGLTFRLVSRRRLLAGRGPSLAGVDAVLTASDTAAGPHRWVRALVERARAAGLPTFTLQHGLDNLERLAALDADPPFASDLMFCWPPQETLPPALARLGGRLACVGRPQLERTLPPPAFDVGVFENLHARTYGDADRETVLAGLSALVRERPTLRIYVRAHPAGGWLDQAGERLRRSRHVTFVSSRRARRETLDGVGATALSARIITTPSTIALDGAIAGRAVALSLDGGPLYAPLPVLRTAEDWIAFADRPAAGQGAAEGAFLRRNLRTGDAGERILARLDASLGKSRAHTSV